MKMLKDIYSNYVFKRIQCEYFSGVFEFRVNPTFRMNKWEVVPNISYNTEELITISVKRMDGKLICDCTELKPLGLPCRHSLAVWNTFSSFDCSSLNIDIRWCRDCEVTNQVRLVDHLGTENSLQLLNPSESISAGRKKYTRYKSRSEKLSRTFGSSKRYSD